MNCTCPNHRAARELTVLHCSHGSCCVANDADLTFWPRFSRKLSENQCKKIFEQCSLNEM